jgi:fatty acid metabolism transcriptional regulator FadR
MKKLNKNLKPAAFVESQIIKKILSGDWKKGDTVPPERQLVEQLGVTRQTIRETLKKLDTEGWITISHGKPTLVNDFILDASLATLKTIAKYADLIPKKLLIDWLEFRIYILPDITQNAVFNNKIAFLNFLKKKPKIDTLSADFALYDWNLQKISVVFSENSIARMLFNDLELAYLTNAQTYFDVVDFRENSIEYYKKLEKTIEKEPQKTAILVRNVMKESFLNFKSFIEKK